MRPLAPRLQPRGDDLDAVLSRLQQAGRSAKGEVDRFLEEKLFGISAAALRASLDSLGLS